MADEGMKSQDAQWTAAWIERQRELLRQQTDQSASSSDEAHGIATRWLDIGRTYLGGLQDFAKQAANGEMPFGSFKVGEELLDVWRNAWTAADAGQQSASRAFADMLRRLPPIGIAREHTEAWRELAATQAECQRLEQELRGVLLGVQGDALSLLEQRVRERQAEKPIEGYRDLYDLWVECAEQVFAKVAHSDAYGKLQAELGNASMRLRSHHQRVLEYGLRQLDLPTRSELNTVHQQLRALKQQVAALKATPASAAKKQTRSPQPRKRASKGRSR